MPYNPPSLSDSIKQIEGDIALELELSLPIVCSERAIAFAVGAAKRDIHDHLLWVSKQIVPTAQSDDSTIEAKAIYEGVPRKLARASKGLVTLTVSDGAALPLGSVLTYKTGTRYLITQAEEAENGTMIAHLQAETPGKAGNLKTDEILTFIHPPPSIATQGIIIEMHGGTDIEPITELLARLYFRKQHPPMGGALHDYEAWATEVHGVTRAWAYDAWHGGSTVGLAFICDNEQDIIPSDDKIEEVKNYIFKHQDPASGEWIGRPAGIETILFKLRLKSIKLEITLFPDTSEIRAAVTAQLNVLDRALSPGQTLLLSQVRTAIGSAPGVRDYHCSLTQDITSNKDELLTFEESQWRIL